MRKLNISIFIDDDFDQKEFLKNISAIVYDLKGELREVGLKCKYSSKILFDQDEESVRYYFSRPMCPDDVPDGEMEKYMNAKLP